MPDNNKKFLDSTGIRYLWDKIKERYDNKIDNIVAEDSSVEIINNNRVHVKLSDAEGNILQVIPEEGLYATVLSDRYEIVQDATSGDYAAVYRLKKYSGDEPAVDAGVINIPKDKVIQSGTVEVKDQSGVWGEPGTYLHLVLANTLSSDLYIPVGSLIEYVTSGSQVGDTVMINIDPVSHQVTASITDGTISADKLDSSVQTMLENAENSIQSIEEGSQNGTISVDNTDVSVHGLGSAAYAASNDFDAAGAAAAVLGTSADTSDAMTVHGLKQYVDETYASLQSEIESSTGNIEQELTGKVDALTTRTETLESQVNELLNTPFAAGNRF